MFKSIILMISILYFKSHHFNQIFSLIIFMQTHELSPSIIEENEIICISVTTLPGEQKYAFTVEAKKMKTYHTFFSVKINDQTEKLLIIIRKKSISQQNNTFLFLMIKSQTNLTKLM